MIKEIDQLVENSIETIKLYPCGGDEEKKAIDNLNALLSARDKLMSSDFATFEKTQKLANETKKLEAELSLRTKQMILDGVKLGLWTAATAASLTLSWTTYLGITEREHEGFLLRSRATQLMTKAVNFIKI